MRRMSSLAAAIAVGLFATAARAEDPEAQSDAVAPPASTPPNVPTWEQRLRPDLFGYVKAGYFLVVPPGEDVLIGSNSGFRIINARLGVRLHPAETLEAVVSVDGAVSRRDETDPLEGSRVVELRDAYLEWTPSRFARLRGGQFKAPFNAEVLLPDEALPFISRSVVSEGLVPPEGFRVDGLALERQIGLQISSERIGHDAHVQYAVALVNGNGANVLNNDNNHLSPAARVQAGYKELVTVGVNVFQNRALIGERPARIAQSQLAYGGDVTVNVAGLNLFGMFLRRQISHEADTGLPGEAGMGAVVSARYLFERLGIEAGARFSWYEPSDVVADDRITEVAALVGYRPKTIPARILLQYTLRSEEAGAQVGNDSVDVLAQVSF